MTFNEAEETTLWAPKAAVACIHSTGSGPPKPPWPASTPQALGSQSCHGLHPLHWLTIIVQQHILWLEVTVDNASLMQVLQATDDLCRVVDGSWF